MKSSIKFLLLAVFVLFILATGKFATDVVDDYLIFNSSDPDSSVVHVQNGVSGVVTITDPTLNETVTMDVNYTLTTGSGVIVSKNGYIITAFHVIGDPQALETQQGLKKMSNDDVNRYIEQAAVAEYILRYNPRLGSEIYGNLPFNYRVDSSDLTNLFIQNNLITVNSSRQVIKVKTSSSNYLDAQLVDVGDPDYDEDIALLKANYTGNNLPALSISSNNPSIGKNIYMYGYPGGNRNSTNLVSINGSVISKVANTQGIVYYETTAPATNGYSGGPALDNRNNILGIVIYAIQSRGHFRSQTSSSHSLFLSSNYLIEICSKNNVPVNIS